VAPLGSCPTGAPPAGATALRDDLETALSDDHRARLLARLYDAALDPAQLEHLLDAWEDAGDDFADPELADHAGRASAVLERGEPPARDDALPGVPARAPGFLSDGGATILAANAAARQLFAIGPGSTLAGLPFEAEDIEALRLRIRRVIAGREAAAPQPLLRLRRSDGAPPLPVRVQRVAAADGRPLAAVLGAAVVWPAGFAAAVQETFGLTATETGILQGLTQGRTVEDIAAARGRSAATVRTQLRTILAKTETHSQAELLRVVLGLMAVAPAPAADVAAALRALPADPGTASLRLGDGRRLEWIEAGDPEGTPCLFMHGRYGLVRWPAAAIAVAAANGIRLIVPIRAGYGGSDPLPPATERLAGCVADYAAVLDRLGCARVAVLSLGADLRLALALAADRPGLVTGIVGCAAMLPLTDPAQYRRMHRWPRFVLANARYAPRMLPFIVKAGFGLARRIGKEAFFATVNGGSRGDMAAFADPGVRAAMLAGSDVALGPGVSAHAAFAAECIDSEGDWSGLIRDAQVPVRLIHGDDDPQMPEATMREVVAGYPGIGLEMIAGGGQMLFFAHWPLVLDRLQPYLAATRSTAPAAR
jgi:pimeloyl-ACP methyl ester carboxylesterase/DNA-binding CsgD family transcriptional regulator